MVFTTFLFIVLTICNQYKHINILTDCPFHDNNVLGVIDWFKNIIIILKNKKRYSAFVHKETLARTDGYNFFRCY